MKIKKSKKTIKTEKENQHKTMSICKFKKAK